MRRLLFVLCLCLAGAASAQAQTQIPPPSNPLVFCGPQATPAADAWELVFDGGAPEPIAMVPASTPGAATTFCETHAPAGWTHSFTLPASRFPPRQAPYTVTGADLAPWAFEGTGLVNGSRFGLYGIEIDSTTPSSPTGTQVLARIPDLLGPGRTAEMTYYESPSGARVFSAGAMNFGGQIALWPEAQRLFENVWARLAPPGG